MKTHKQDGVAIYTRLSDEDGRDKQSRSIENQRDICLKYAERKGWRVDRIFVDDGYTGTNFDRPDYIKMKKAIEKGDIKCVIVKDLSRFGRNAALMSIELEHFNDDYGLRFISITEDLDATSTNDYSEVFQIMNVLNEMYPKDCSRKIRHSWQNGVSDGKFMFGTPPFGYQRGDTDALQMVVDPVAAQYVKRIFNLYATGTNMRAIAEMLNRERIPSPRGYYYLKKGKSNPVNENNTWSSNTIRGILENEAYIGNLVQGKRRAVSYKNKKRKPVPRDDWYRTENAHEAIIDDLLWEEVQRKRGEKHHSIRKNGKVAIFSGLLKCAECGSVLAHTYAREKSIYRCSRYNTNGYSSCSPHRVYEADLVAIVSAEIRKYASLAVSKREQLIKAIYDRFQEEKSSTQISLTERKKLVVAKIEDNQKLLRSLLEDRSKGLIPDKLFRNQTMAVSNESDMLEDELSLIRSQLIQERDEMQRIELWTGIIEKHLRLETIDRIAVAELIDKIEISEQQSTGKRAMDVTIHFRFVGQMNPKLIEQIYNDISIKNDIA